MKTVGTGNKVGRNTRCPCNSGKKYKQCCLLKEMIQKSKEDDKYKEGQSDSSENVLICTEYLRDEYANHKVIDITNDLNGENYKTYQTKNYTEKIIMVAEKTEQNKDVFTTRGQMDNDMIIMYRGSYRTFRLNDMDKVTDSIDKMIQTRLAGNDDK